jgi:hypothetical protein
MMGRGNHRFSWPQLRALVLLIVLCTPTICCTKSASEKVFFDFESDSELDRFYWRCHTLFGLAKEHATHGIMSLRLELHPSDYPGLTPALPDTDWKGYKSFDFDVYNPQEEVIPLGVRIDDRKDYPDWSDRYNQTFSLSPGPNVIRIPLDSLVTSETNRRLNQRKIYALFIFMANPRGKTVLYFDYLRLVGEKAWLAGLNTHLP